METTFRKPIYKVFNEEIGTFIQHFIYDETKGQREAWLKVYTYPRGHYDLLMDDGTAEDAKRFEAIYEDLRPLTPPVLRVVR